MPEDYKTNLGGIFVGWSPQNRKVVDSNLHRLLEVSQQTANLSNTHFELEEGMQSYFSIN